MTKSIGLGVIGAGYISCAHSIAFNSVAAIMQPEINVNFVAACSPFKDELNGFKERFSFSKGYENWQDLVADDDVDLVVIGSPPNLHFEQAKMALENGKHVLVEKPVANSAAECKELCEIAKAKNLKSAVGFTYMANPGMFQARKIIKENKLGQIYSFNGHFFVDDFAKPETAFHWCCDQDIAGAGTTNDLGYHVLVKLVTLLGMPQSAVAYRQTKIKQRKDKDGKMREVTSDDLCSAILDYGNETGDISGTIQVSRVGMGRDQFLHLEINGSEGSLVLDMENMNHLYLYLREEDKALEGFRRIMIAAEHENYGKFCPAAGHGMGFNDFIVIQNGLLLGEIAGTKNYQAIANLDTAYRVQKIVDALVESSDNEKWVDISPE